MSAPVLILAVSAEAATPVALGAELSDAAMRGECALSDAEGCNAVLLRAYPGLCRRDLRAARRVAIDIAQHAARYAPAVAEQRR